MSTYSSIDKSAHESANGNNPLRPATPAQAVAGNYKKGRCTVQGMRIAIENPRGSLRQWKSPDGTSGANLMKFHYGYFEGVKGADGDELDVYVGPYPESDRVFVINQELRGSFDEHKVMLGFPDKRTAEAGYLSNFNAGWRGLGSCVECSLAQFKWWLANGNKSRPLTLNQLPYEERKDMDKVIWDSTNQPIGSNLAAVLYRIRAHDGSDGLIFDSLSMSDILADADGVLAMDALVIPFAKLQPRMEVLQKVMDRAGKAVKVASMQVSDPFMQRGTTNVAVIYELSDGQTVSVFFHNPDTTPKKITSADQLISWKWMLNKKDVTIVVAPERGRDLNVRTVAARVMALAEKNSERFAAANSKRAERMQTIASLKTELETKEAELDGLEKQIQEVEVELEGRPAAAQEATPSAVDLAGKSEAYVMGYNAQKRGFAMHMPANYSRKKADKEQFEDGWMAAKAESDATPAPVVEPVSGLLSDEEQAALQARTEALQEQFKNFTDDQVALIASLLSVINPQNKPRERLLNAIFANHPDDIENAIERWKATNAPAAAPAAASLRAEVERQLPEGYSVSGDETSVVISVTGGYTATLAIKPVAGADFTRLYGEVSNGTKTMEAGSIPEPEIDMEWAVRRALDMVLMVVEKFERENKKAAAPAAEPAAPAESSNPGGLSDAEMVVLIAAVSYKSAFRLKNAMYDAGISEEAYYEALENLNTDGKYLKRSAITDAGRALVSSFMPESVGNANKLRAFKGKFNAPAAPAAEAKPDLTYSAIDDMFTAFYPETEAGKEAWNTMAKEDGHAKVLHQHVADVVGQLRAAGYTVAEAPAVEASEADDDALLNELTPEPVEPAVEVAPQPDPVMERISDATFKQWKKVHQDDSTTKTVNGWLQVEDNIARRNEAHVLLSTAYMVRFSTAEEATEWAKKNKAGDALKNLKQEQLAEFNEQSKSASEPAAPAEPESFAALRAIIDGSRDLSDAGIPAELKQLHADNAGNAEFMDLFKQAVKAYSAFAVAKANAALAK